MVHFRHLLLATCAALLSPAAVDAKPRVWTDTQGRKVTADFVRVNEGAVVLKRTNGRVISVPFRNLSAADQDYVRRLLAESGDEDLLPPKGDDGAGGFPPGAGIPGRPPGAIPPGNAPRAGPTEMPGGIGPPGADPSRPMGPGAGLPAGLPGAGGQNGLTPPGAPGRGAGPGGGPVGGPPGMPPGMIPAIPPGMQAPGRDGPNGEVGRPRPEPQREANRPRLPVGVVPVGGGPAGPAGAAEDAKSCNKCGKQVPATSKAGDKCPHCGVVWGFEHEGAEQATDSTDNTSQIVAGVVGTVLLLGFIGIVARKRSA